ncbi:uro-adherence factor A-like isoform X2 [Montipora foliosa]|uniref:uro-adherence factor A-like isoform X2 n=1 Tax=Montipora foliosa TaxID=591990 RepID=UPI0035F1DF0E
MQITTVHGLLVLVMCIQGLLGLPVDRELVRVKRKRETGNEQDAELVRKVRRLLEEKETELRHKRRFFAREDTENEPQEGYKSKMEARSSRSAREDNDITAGRSERFRFRIRKRSSGEDESMSLPDNSSGSGEQLESSSASGFGLWGPKSRLSEALAKRNEKRSMSVNSLNSLIAALKAISSLTPGEPENSSEATEMSGSGVTALPEIEEEDDKLPKFFQEEGSSASGENPEEALKRINEAAQKELNGTVEHKSRRETKSVLEQKRLTTKENLVRRELQSDSLADDLVAAVENEKESSETESDDEASYSGSAHQENKDEDEEITNTDSTTEQIKDGPEVHVTKEVEPLHSLTDALLQDSFYRTRRSSQENFFLRSDDKFRENDALDGESLIVRFYRDQDAPEPSDISLASLPSDTQAVLSDGEQEKPEKREAHYEPSGDLTEPRVIYTRELRDAPEAIIERPAVYSQSIDENEMDSSYGGEDDDDEATLTIHEREIRDDGYVGCFEDKSSERDLPRVLSVPHLTPDSCRTACQNAGHAYAGVQYGYLCRCGDTYGKYGKVPDEECNALCTGDKAQKCGGFWKSAVFTTDGAMQPSKRGNFFHIDSVQPITEDIFDMPRSDIPSSEDQSHEIVTLTESSKKTDSVSQAPKEPPPIPAATSSGSYIKEIHRESSLQETQISKAPEITVKESTLPSRPKATPHDNTTHALIDEPTHTGEGLSIASSNESLPGNEDRIRSENSDSESTVSPSSSATAPLEVNETSLQQVTVPLDSPTYQIARYSQPENELVPQGTHVSQLMYLHQQQDILSKPTPKTIVGVPPGDVEVGTVAYTGTIKLKQSWLDQFEDGESAESKILSGNIEQAFKNVFKDDPMFISAEVVGFREGLVKHNPNTIRKVIVPFILTFKSGIKGVEDNLKSMVKTKGKLDDMPVYKNSLQIAEYAHSLDKAKPVNKTVKVDKTKTVNKTVKEENSGEEAKRSAVKVPRKPYTMQLFLMKDLFGKKKRRTLEYKE